MDIYNAIFEKIQAKVDDGEYTLEEATQLNDLAYHRYVEESMELDATIDTIENSLIEESRSADRYFAKKAKEGVEKHRKELEDHLNSEQSARDYASGGTKAQRQQAKEEFDAKTKKLTNKFARASAANSVYKSLKTGTEEDRNKLREMKDKFYRDMARNHRAGSENELSHKAANDPVSITRNSDGHTLQRKARVGQGVNRNYLDANTPTEKEQKQIDANNKKLEKAVPNKEKKRFAKEQKELKATNRANDKLKSIEQEVSGIADAYVNNKPYTKKSENKPASKKILTRKDAVTKKPIEGKGFLNKLKAFHQSYKAYEAQRKSSGNTVGDTMAIKRELHDAKQRANQK